MGEEEKPEGSSGGGKWIDQRRRNRTTEDRSLRDHHSHRRMLTIHPPLPHTFPSSSSSTFLSSSSLRSLASTVSVHPFASPSPSPSPSPASAILLSRQYWMSDRNCKVCYDCGLPFQFFRRRHHCRSEKRYTEHKT